MNFEIKTYTYSIKSELDNYLLKDNLKYIIPIYQRPYSWTETNIEIFINDIFISFWGHDKDYEQVENLFIGTMQLSKVKDNTQDIIDGQQRVTTITLLLKFLQNEYPDNITLQSLKFDWLDTKVNRGQQSHYLQDVLKNNNLKHNLNKYAQNYILIENYFKKNLENTDEFDEFDEKKFTEHLMNNLYFVVIETDAGLSKTLKIFNAINTTGLDLNTTDIFKIRFYEYLTDIEGNNENIFDEIDILYETVDKNNKKADRKIADMNTILSIYKSYLISKYNLNTTLWKMATGTFFEQLFDTLLNIKIWNGFSVLIEKKNILKIKDIKHIIDVRYIWEEKYYGENGTFDDFNTMLSLRLLWWSRYSNYWNLAFLYLLREDASDKKYNELIHALSRLYISYTLLHKKKINAIHIFTRKIFKSLIKDEVDIDEIIIQIKEKYKSEKEKVIEVYSGDIFWSPKIKNILTRMSAAIEENKVSNKIKDIEKLIFDTQIDVEHIKSRNDKDFEDIKLKDEWKDTLNTVGNLMILEFSINRSISNSPFVNKVKSYKNSEFLVVKNFSSKYPVWELSDAKVRKECEIDKITKFLYTKD